MPDPEVPTEAADEIVGDVGEAAVGETAKEVPITVGAADPVTDGREANPDRAQWMADKDKDLQMAATVAEQAGRPEKAEELRQSADVEAQKGAAEFDHEQRRQVERSETELRIQEYERRAEQERLQRFETEVNALIDKVLEAVNLEPGQEVELLDDIAWPAGFGSEPKIAALYERLKLQRPNDEATPAHTYDISEGGPSARVGKQQVERSKYYRTPTTFGVVLTETRYTPGHQYHEGDRVLLTVEKAEAQPKV